ncbi:MAG: hypothetical protein AAF569_04185 [Pseudomonadota bacterium]
MSLRIFRISNIFSWSVAILFGSLLFWVSQSVQRAEEELRYLNHKVNLELEAIRVLEAEWDYLNSPMRLEKLATEHIPAQPVTADQVMEDISAIPQPPVAPLIPPVKPIPVSLSAPAEDVAETSEPQDNIIQNSDRNKFNALLENLNDEGGF